MELTGELKDFLGKILGGGDGSGGIVKGFVGKIIEFFIYLVKMFVSFIVKLIRR